MWPIFQPELLSGAFTIVNPGTVCRKWDQAVEGCVHGMNVMASKHINKKNVSIHEKETWCE